nr:MAG TPA: hypothetical protein [Podoviridae sp. ct13o21]
MLPAPAPWPYIADFTRPEGLQRRPHWALFFSQGPGIAFCLNYLHSGLIIRLPPPRHIH